MSLRRTPAKTVSDTIDFKEGFLQSKVTTDNSAMESLQREVLELKSKLEMASKPPEAMNTIGTRSKYEHHTRSGHEDHRHHATARKAADVMSKLDKLETQLKQDVACSDHNRMMSMLNKPAPDHISTKVMSKIDALSAKLNSPAPDHISANVMSKLDRLEAKLNSPAPDHISAKVMSKLDALEAKLGSTDPIMKKLNLMEAKLNAPADHVMSKLDRLEKCMPTADKLGSAMSHIDKVHSELHMQKSLSNQVMDKLTQLESKLNIKKKSPAVTLEMYENERKNLMKLEKMRAKLAACG